MKFKNITGTIEWVLLMMVLVANLCSGRQLSRRGEPHMESYFKEITMPGVSTSEKDEYLCTAVALNATLEEWVIRYDPLASATRAHHMLLFGCQGVNEEFLRAGYWDCGHHGVCGGSRIMFAWAKNAPSTKLPPDVGFRIGGKTGINYLTLQIHYANPIPDTVKDHSGLKLEVTTEQQKYKAGIYLLASGYADIPPRTEKTHADMNCVVGESGEPTDIHLFAYRVHAHKLGSVITGYITDKQAKQFTQIAKGNPQWPQAFYPMDTLYLVKTSDIIHARCTWNSMSRDRHTYIGSTGEDEMCNLYLMYYTDRDEGSEAAVCGWENFSNITKRLPAGNDEPCPPNPLLEEQSHGENTNKDNEVTYNNIFNGNSGDIEVEKKGHSRKKPKPTVYARPLC